MRSFELVRRLVLGLAIATLAATVLWWSIDRVEAGHEGERAALPPSRARASQVALPPTLPRGYCETITLARNGPAVPRDAAPAVEIRLGGGVHMLRAAPAPRVPDEVAHWKAAIVVPRERLGELGAVERAALLEVLRAWGGGAVVGPERIRSAGVRYGEAELEGLLRWQR